LLQSRFSEQPTSGPSPTCSFLRANSCPKVTNQPCRLPLPTLFYRPEAVHLGDLLRIWVRLSTKITLPPSDFQGPTIALWTPQEPRSFTVTTSLSPGKLFSGSRNLTKKRQLFPGLSPTSPSLFALPRLYPKVLSPCLSLGILTQFPFGLFSQNHQSIDCDF